MHVEVRREWKSGWSLVLASTIGISVINVMVYSTSLLINPLQAEFGWSRAQITSGLLINSVVAVACAPFLGRMIDRFGPRRLAIPGLVLFCAVFGGLAAANGSLWQWSILWVVIAFVTLMLKPTLWTTAVASRFDRSRGLALAITLSGTGMTGFLVPLVGGFLLNAYGWRIMVIGLVLIWCGVALPLALMFFHGAVDIRRVQLKTGQDVLKESTGVGALEGLLTFKYLRLALSVLMIFIVVAGTQIHLVSFYIGAGLKPVVAATIASMIGVMTIVGRLGTGFLLDRFNGALVGAFFFVLPAFLMVGLLFYNGSIGMALALAGLLGLSVGAELDIAAYMTSRHFGLRNYGFLFGIMVGLMSLALGVGPWLMGTIFDHFGSYRIAFICAMPISIIASLLVASLGKYDPRFAPGAPQH